MKIKLCGMRRPEDVAYANEFCPDYIGFVFAKSRRQVAPEQAGELSSRLRPEIQTVGVFVNEPVERLLEAVRIANLHVIQLHGDEDEDYIRRLRSRTGLPVWKAVRVSTVFDILKADALPVDALVLDSCTPGAYGGTGRLADWEVICRAARRKAIFLAGGLRADNIQRAVRLVRPFGVDLSGGIETDGIKDREKIRAVMALVRGTGTEEIRERQENA